MILQFIYTALYLPKNICSGILFVEVIVMNKHTIDLLSIPVFQQMVRVVYIDRCMVKWAGMLLSEHSEQMKDSKGQSDGNR